MKINALKEMVGAVVPEVTGEITKLWPVSNGVNNLGKAYSKQSGTLRDDTGEIDFTIWNRTELPQSLRGIEMTIKAGMGLKGGLRGLKVKKHYKDPSKIVLDIEDKATISDKENSIQEDAKDDLDMSPPSEKGVTMKDAAISKPIPKEIPSDFRVNQSKSPQERIAQFGKLYGMCLEQVKGFDMGLMSKTDLKDIASCLFISAMKEGLADKMEVKEEF